MNYTNINPTKNRIHFSSCAMTYMHASLAYGRVDFSCIINGLEFSRSIIALWITSLWPRTTE